MKNRVGIIEQILLDEFSHHVKNGLYSQTQTMMAYHSNHIEGSTLTEEQMAFLFDTGTIGGDNQFYRTKNIEEAQGHFLMFNEMLKHIEEPLSQEMIKNFHYALKAGVFEDRANGYAIGNYKTRPNRVGTIQTSLPEEVACDMNDLMEWYEPFSSKTYADQTEYHVRFEKIHPFQDGNGRVGRMILFRECLYHRLPPIIVMDHQSLAYKQAIGYAQNEYYFTRLKTAFEESIAFYENASHPYVEAYLKHQMDPDLTPSIKEPSGPKL